MYNGGLVSYIYYYAKKGYDVYTLRNYLYQLGYNIQDIDDSIRYVQYYYPDAFQQLISPVITPEVQVQKYPQQQTVEHYHKIELSKKTLVSLFFILIFLPATIFLFFNMDFSGNPEKLLDISTEPITTSVKPGEEVKFSVQLESFGTENRYDTRIKSTLYSPTNEILDEKQIVKAVETKSSEVMSLSVPKEAVEGRYKVKTEVSYNELNEEASFLFMVEEERSAETCYDGIKNQDEEGVDCGGSCINNCKSETEKPTCSDGIKNQGETKVDCGGPCGDCEVSCYNCIPRTPCEKAECVGEKCKFTPITPCCGNFYCETGESHDKCPADCDLTREEIEKTPKESREEASEIAQEDVEKAARICDSLEEQNDKDKCFKDIGKTSNVSTMCTYISNQGIKDECYMQIVMQGDYSLCDKISNRQHQSTCRALKKASKLQKMSQNYEFDESDIPDIANIEEGTEAIDEYIKSKKEEITN